MQELDQRVKRFDVRLTADGKLEWQYLGAFGDTSTEGALRMVAEDLVFFMTRVKLYSLKVQLSVYNLQLVKKPRWRNW